MRHTDPARKILQNKFQFFVYKIGHTKEDYTLLSIDPEFVGVSRSVAILNCH
jgi:hypothetical protein